MNYISPIQKAPTNGFNVKILVGASLPHLCNTMCVTTPAGQHDRHNNQSNDVDEIDSTIEEPTDPTQPILPPLPLSTAPRRCQPSMQQPTTASQRPAASEQPRHLTSSVRSWSDPSKARPPARCCRAFELHRRHSRINLRS